MVHSNEHIFFVDGMMVSVFLVGLVWGTWSEPVAKSVSFFDGPFTLEQVHCEAVVFKMMENGMKELNVSLPWCGEGSNIMNVEVRIVNSGKTEEHFSPMGRRT